MTERLQPTIKVMDIWEVRLTDTVGHEQRGSRPAIVIAIHNAANLCSVVPLTSNQDASRFPFTHSISRSSRNGLICDSIALIFQLRCLDLTRFIQKIGILDQPHVDRIKALVKSYMNL